MTLEEMKKEFEEQTKYLLDANFRKPIWQWFESKLKQEIEQAEIRGWNNCYRTYIEDNDDDTALTNKQEIESACKKQREICAKAYLRKRGYNETANSIISTVIRNAPSPEVKEKQK